MAEIEGSDGTPKNLGGDDARASRPSSDSASTVDERQPRISSNFARATSNRDRGRPSLSENSEPTLERGRSISSARIQPLPTPVISGYRGPDAGGVTFDPQDLLQEGLGEWQDRALSLLTLKRSSSIAAAKGYRGLEQTPSFRFDRQQSARRSHDSYGETEDSTQGAVRYSTGRNYPIYKFQVKLNTSSVGVEIFYQL